MFTFPIPAVRKVLDGATTTLPPVAAIAIPFAQRSRATAKSPSSGWLGMTPSVLRPAAISPSPNMPSLSIQENAIPPAIPTGATTSAAGSVATTVPSSRRLNV